MGPTALPKPLTWSETLVKRTKNWAFAKWNGTLAVFTMNATRCQQIQQQNVHNVWNFGNFSRNSQLEASTCPCLCPWIRVMDSVLCCAWARANVQVKARNASAEVIYKTRHVNISRAVANACDILPSPVPSGECPYSLFLLECRRTAYM